MCKGGMERSPATKTSEEVYGAGGVATGGATRAVAAGVDVVALVSLAGTATDLCDHGTL